MITELILWVWDHKEEVTFNTLLLFILRRYILKELAKLIRPSRTDAVLHNQKIILRELGVESEWKSSLPMNGLKIKLPRTLRRLYLFSRMVTRTHRKTRRKTMNRQNINYVTLIPVLLAFAKLVLQACGIAIPDDGVNEIVNGIAGLGTGIGIFLPHTKKVTDQVVSVAKTSGAAMDSSSATYQDIAKMTNLSINTFNQMLADFKKNDGSDAYKTAVDYFVKFKSLTDGFVLPEPITEIPEQKESA